MRHATKVKISLYSSVALAGCTPMARYIFPGLKIMGGSGRRVEEDIKRIKNELMSLDDDLGLEEVKDLINELVSAGMLVRTIERDRRYLVIQSVGKRGE